MGPHAKLKSCIAASLWAGALLLLVLVVSAALWGILSAVDDQGAVDGVKGVALVALACWLLNFIGLVVLTAVAQLRVPHEDSEEEA